MIDDDRHQRALLVWPSLYAMCRRASNNYRPRQIMRSVVFVHLSISLFPLFWTNWRLTLIYCVCMGRDHSTPGIESQRDRSRSMPKCVCYTSIYCGVLLVLTDGRNSTFLLSRHQLRASAAWRAVWRGWGQRQHRIALVGVLMW